jgi:polar amino acid transport system substrate-binding protein
VGRVIVRRCVSWLVAIVAASGLGVAAASTETAEQRILEGGWFDLPPYAHLDRDGRPTGFDIALLREVGRRAGITFSLREIDWSRTQTLVREGRLDFGLAAFRTPEREAYALLSAPYRKESDSLFLRPRTAARIAARTPDTLLAEVRQLGLRIGIVEGYNYGPQAMAFLAERAAAVVVSRTDVENVVRMSAGEIDGFLADRLSGYHAIASADVRAIARAVALPVFEGDVHVLFSRATVKPEVVRRFDQALAAVVADGTYERIRTSFVVPTMMEIAISTGWFHALDWVGTVAYAISGVLIARREQYSVFGALVLAFLPAVGGSVVGDLLVGREPIGILEEPAALILVLGTVVIGYALFRLHDFLHGRFAFMLDVAWLFLWTRRYVPPRNVYEGFDALALSAFTVTGVVVAIRYAAEPLWIWGPFLAVLAAAGGSILRDVIRSDAHNPSLKTSLYAEIALVWGLVLSLWAKGSDVVAGPGRFQAAVILVVAGAFISRMAVVIMRVRSPRF